MPRLIAALIRHGEYRQRPETPSAHQPFPLTAEGIAQAQQAGAALRQILEQNQWEVCTSVQSSFLLRAWQTAKIIADELSNGFKSAAHVDCFEALAERGLGSAANLSTHEIESIIHEDPRHADLPKDWKSNSHFQLPLQGAESLMQAGERVARHLNETLSTLSKQTHHDTLQLFIGHGAAFRHAAYHLDILKYEQIAQLSMYHCKPLFLEYQTDNQWRHIDGEWKRRRQHSEYKD